MWEKLKRSRNGIYEMWKTYGRYLVCIKYKQEFKYFDNYIEAAKYFYRVSK